MAKTILLTLGITTVVVGVGLCLAFSVLRSPAAPPAAPGPASFDPLNATYTLSGSPVALVNGRTEQHTTLGSASTTITSVFGEPVPGDLNGDGRADAAVIITQTSGGSGTFYYAAAAINTGNDAQGTNAVLLGDRIAPQTIEIRNGQLIANYAERRLGEPMTTKPSVGVSKYLVLDGVTLKPAQVVASPGERCGGNMTTAPRCVTGYHCAPVFGSHLPFGDVGGTCVAN